MKPLMIEVGLNEATERADNPTVPISPAEIAEDILAVARAGACAVHFHARDPQSGAQRMNDFELYSEAIRRVRDAGCDIWIYPTYPTYVKDFDQRMGHYLALAEDRALNVRLGSVEMGSFNLAVASEGMLLNPDEASPYPVDAGVNSNSFAGIRRGVCEFAERGLLLTLAAFEPGHARLAAAFMDAGIVPDGSMLKFFLSDDLLVGPLANRAGVECYLAVLEGLGQLGRWEWFVAPMLMSNLSHLEQVFDAAIELGGHIRTGVGDLPRASRGKSNAELITEVAARAARQGRSVATPTQVHELCRYRRVAPVPPSR